MSTEPTADPSGMLLHGILGSINEFYSRNLATEVVKGMNQKVQTGGTPTLAPIGYLNTRRIVNGVEIRTVETDPDRADLIRFAFDTYATGTCSLHQLATELETHGLTQRATAKRIERPLTAKELGRVLHKPYYKGIVSWKGVEFEGTHEPLTTPETWARVQDVIAAHRQSGERSYRRKHYLAGTLLCGHCNSKLLYGISTGRRGDKYAYWFCNGRHSKQNGCTLPYLAEHLIEPLVVQQWHGERLSDEQATSIRDGLLTDLTDHTTAATDRRAQIQSRIDVIQRARRKWAEKAITGAVPDDIARDEQTRLGKQLTTAQDNLAALTITDEQHLDAIKAAVALLPICGEAYQRGDQKLRREYNQAWFSGIYITADDGQPRISRVKRTEPIEALHNAEVHDQPQEVSVSEQVIENKNPREQTSQRKGRGSFGYRVLTRLPDNVDVGGSNVALLVETLRRYANTPGLADDLSRAKQQVERRRGTYPDASHRGAGASPRTPQFTLDQLTDVQINELARQFLAGKPKTQLAREYGISLSSVKRILRRSRQK